MRATRGLCLFVSFLAGLRETLADSTLFDFHVYKTPTLDVKPSYDPPRDLVQRQLLPDYGTLSLAFRAATWIWTADADGAPLFNAPLGDRVFRTTYIPPAGKTAVQAEILITVDNSFSLLVNGALAGASPPNNPDSWRSAQGYRMTLNPGPIVFAVRGTNLAAGAGAVNPAGLLAAIRITHSDATQTLIVSDGTWRSNIVPIPGFELPTTDDSRWVAAKALARFGTGPWGVAVTLPGTLATVTLPTPTPSSTLPSTTSSLTNSTSLPSSTSSLPSTSSSPPLTSSSTVTITQTSLSGDTTAPVSAPNSSSNTKSTRPALIGAILGGMIGGLVLLTLLLIFWRRRRRAAEVAAADFDTWTPAPHTTHVEPFTDQSSSSQQYGSETKYGQPQAPYRYPPPSMSTSSVSTPAAQPNYYQPQYGGSGGGDGQRPAAWGSTAQLIPGAQAPQTRMNSVPSTLTPGSAAPAYYSPSNVDSRPMANPYEPRYY